VSSSPAATTASLSHPRAAIAAVLISILLGALDQTIVSVAVPTIAHQLGGFEWMAWVIAGYLIASTVVTPLYGKFGDLYGGRTMMSVAIVVFLVASVGCALAQSLPQLVFARVLQGIGGGGLIAMSQSVIAEIVPMRERGRFQGYIAMLWAAASVTGPVVGGVLTQYLSWPWLFWINVPFALLALVLVRRALVAKPRSGRRLTIDWAGVVLLVGGLTALLVPITRLAQGVAFHDPANLAGFALAVVMLLAFWWHEGRTAQPVLPVSLLADRTVLSCCTILFVSFFVYIALTVLVPLRLQLVAGLPVGQAGLGLMPLTLSVPFAVFISGRWMSRSARVRPLQYLGVATVPLALVALAFLHPTQVVASNLVMIALGLGFGCQNPTSVLTVQSTVPRALVGTATGLTVFFRLLGGAVGVAVLSSIMLTRLRDVLPPGTTAAGLEAMGSLMRGAQQPPGRLAAADAAFRVTLLCGAAISLVSVWCARYLPDVRLDESKAPPPLAAE
jgi:EmrB/QacA subfamily drug resistance transporter